MITVVGSACAQWGGNEEEEVEEKEEERERREERGDHGICFLPLLNLLFFLFLCFYLFIFFFFEPFQLIPFSFIVTVPLSYIRLSLLYPNPPSIFNLPPHTTTFTFSSPISLYRLMSNFPFVRLS